MQSTDPYPSPHPYILVLNGSIKPNSSNQKLITAIIMETDRLRQKEGGIVSGLAWETFPIGTLPFFNPAQDSGPTVPTTDKDKRDADPLPATIQSFRQKVAKARGVLICTPEYVFSLPGVLKNALEWLVSTTLLSDKPVALITAAASGKEAKASLERITETLGGKFTPDSSIRIQGIAGKFNPDGMLIDRPTIQILHQMIRCWTAMMAPADN